MKDMKTIKTVDVKTIKKIENLTEEEKIILSGINFYYNSIGLTCTKDLDIKRINYKNNTIHLLLSHPGVFIGRYGKNINEITEILRLHLNNPKLKFRLEQSFINSYLLTSGN